MIENDLEKITFGYVISTRIKVQREEKNDQWKQLPVVGKPEFYCG